MTRDDIPGATRGVRRFRRDPGFCLDAEATTNAVIELWLFRAKGRGRGDP